MFYKYLTIEDYSNKIEPEIKQFITDIGESQTIFYNKLNKTNLFDNCPNLKNWIYKNNLNCAVAASVLVPPNTLSNAHSVMMSGIHKDLNAHKYAINFGILNYEESPTVLFKLKDSNVSIPTKMGISPGVVYEDYGAVEMIETCRFLLTQPVIWDSTIPHSIFHAKNSKRITLTLRFTTDISYMLD